ncbi:putative fumarylacetoacetase [Flexivirga endophytica]|uniref:fumarylacetoacetase n=1 Tax=Flexivirga endophytica TaxID=1849103 RepID=A0A916TDR5_9MICO|nr:fumarylacetoacetase [Flexivirga endophytica]GGB39587.1 putative fumarylacetoacetase [Flexivirga endophytica]GHB47504.1 putative fumarylacetoacetase [Flexivirga endophytica]
MNGTELWGIDNLPYGVASTADGGAQVVTRLGDDVIELATLAKADSVRKWARIFDNSSLNPFLTQGRSSWSAAREWLQAILRDDERKGLVAAATKPLADVTLHLPVQIADYVDFYASEQHATNVGSIFRPDGAALTPNWKHLPIGYHGRSGTVVVSGTDVVRPVGQRKGKDDPEPLFGPSVRLDIEAEVGFIVGGETEVGTRVSVDEAGEHLFGVALFNDWSARDIQAWEYVPLGPFLGKSFASTLSPWITPMEALKAAKLPLPAQDPKPLDYLRGDDLFGLDLELEVRLNDTVVSRPPYKKMYWSPTQMLAHLTVNGASLRDGDLFASGTVSGDARDQRGSLLELAWSGKEPVRLDDGTERSFLEDGDIVTITATAPAPDGGRLALGEVSGRIIPSV